MSRTLEQLPAGGALQPDDLLLISRNGVSYSILGSAIINPGVDKFTSTWNTANVNGGSNDHQVQLPLIASGTYDFVVDWGDGNTDTITAWDQAETTHTYASVGTYTLTITGQIDGFNLYAFAPEKNKIINIMEFGSLTLGNDGDYFRDCLNLTITATDALDLTGTTTLQNIFNGCVSLTTAPSMALWDTAAVNNMNSVFEGCVLFNQDISSWDVSAVQSMDSMFYGCAAFNQPLNSWDVSNVTNMSSVFNTASSFNQPLNSWVTTSVTNMEGMFQGATAFNQDISGWDVSNVTTMNGVFSDATSFNGDITTWDVSSVTDMNSMFLGATSFNQDIGGWVITALSEAHNMFDGVTLSTANYSNLLIGWGAQVAQNDVVFSGGNSTYSGAPAIAARGVLTTTYNWSITDGGVV